MHVENMGKKLSWTGIFLRGCAMGAADIVPGVSGGTIAFISGIYERLLGGISAVPATLVRGLKHRQPARLWAELDAGFLSVLLAGIMTSIVLLAGLVKYLMENEAILLWSFFFGLILAAIWHVGRQIPRWSGGALPALAVGTFVSFGITLLAPAQIAVTGLTVFGSGALAICAMILPGISGSFILLLLGMYAPIIGAIDERAFGLLGLFASGCLIGLLLFSRLIAWSLQRYTAVAMALLTGFMVGSLNKIWPWKVTQEWGVDRSGNPLPLVEANVSPLDYASMVGEPHHLLPAIGLAIAGFVLVLALEKLGNRVASKHELKVSH